MQANFRRYFCFILLNQAQTQLDHLKVLDELLGERRGCTKGCFLVPAKPIHILCVISFRYCPFVIETLALTGLRFGTFGGLNVGWVTAYKPGMMTLNSN